MGGTEHDYYELLGVPETATSAEIVSAYRQISRRVHPTSPQTPRRGYSA